MVRICARVCKRLRCRFNIQRKCTKITFIYPPKLLLVTCCAASYFFFAHNGWEGVSEVNNEILLWPDQTLYRPGIGTWRNTFSPYNSILAGLDIREEHWSCCACYKYAFPFLFSLIFSWNILSLLKDYKATDNLAFSNRRGVLKIQHSWQAVLGKLRMQVMFHRLMKTVYWSLMMTL